MKTFNSDNAAIQALINGDLIAAQADMDETT